MITKNQNLINLSNKKEGVIIFTDIKFMMLLITIIHKSTITIEWQSWVGENKYSVYEKHRL